MMQKCSCKKECLTSKENLKNKIQDIKECEKCKDIQIKKFSPLKEAIDIDLIDNEYMRCECGKRPIDVVMSHILKIMIEEKIVKETASLRRNSPVPLSDFYYSTLNHQFIGKNTFILLHKDFTKKAAKRLINEVDEVKGILKGDPRQTAGQYDKNSKIKHYELLEGCDIQSNVVQTLIGEKLIFNKKQSENHIEVAMTTEEKLLRLHTYLEKNNIKKGVALDGMCGGGALGIYLLKYGFDKVIFNDINPETIDVLKDNLKVNEINEKFEITCRDFEDIEAENIDLCVLDPFPKADIENIKKKAEEISENVVII